MKTQSFYWSVRHILLYVFISSFIVPPLSFSSSSVPLPLCIYYGQALDGYGWPYRQNADVILFHGTNEIVRHTIEGSLTPGVNFSLPVHLHNGIATNPYVDHALKSGDLVSIRVEDRFGRKTIMENAAIPAVGDPGDIIRIRVTAGDDADGDGIPDDFERELSDDIESILPGDDYDGDGVSNLDEYRAGTFAFLDYDYFFAEAFRFLPNRRIRVDFLSVPGKVYSLYATSNLLAGVWSACPYAQTENGELKTGVAEGSGDWMSFFAPITPDTPILRLEVE